MWATLDFEASGLSEFSYPIEVGYSLPNGKDNSLLINPLSASDDWVYWDDFSESHIHKITRYEVESNGKQVVDVCRHLNTVLGEYELVFCDSEWDLFWLGRLYHAAHMRPSFMLTEICCWLKQYNGLEREHFQLALERQGPVQHRASHDAKQIRLALDALVGNR
ncbi:hypothetical protein [Photobacterium phosphoreum]|jgi:hypothetical protein|uniref:hypothetical protein n=1 Tax=Photobacterium phosphoreum TaxID=659 RepID=UPI0007F8EE2C|nr:hypothetical protein [Photobacterium phosphoreum]MCD9462961.1 hypothetical protein [Photobacterium phosphoreum]MCD9470069.1 hypothetical protein [Photobacterium phosphoreum]MCD9474574.1 hypothetical protein [Photobacterium phosphoreum]MCD9478083.1 hypothetical protein [Photobacterium phosphoreum]MCD9482631.1 hypothetical protein [Photobacterium phosphoreum]